MTSEDISKIFKEYPKTERYPVLFIGHGSPMNGVEDNVFTRGWETLGHTLPKPRAILMVSAHWLAGQSGVDVSDNPKTIHDFYGFPQELYKLSYPAPGAPILARDTRNLLSEYHLGEEKYGLDHGAWVVLYRMYPEADVPVFQLAIDFPKPASHHYEIGKALAILRERGVLIIGSGNIVHNLRDIDWNPDAKAFDWAQDFDERVKSLVLNGEHEALCEYVSIGHSAARSVPTPDHYYPLLYVLGAGGKEARVSFPVEGITHGSISMRCLLLD
jgi:4,5-DOPA dioxygenase extradiol